MSEIQYNDTWPRCQDGTVDWEFVFENPENGLIPIIEQARKPETLIDCTAMIVQSLFTRDGDEDIRARYTQELATLALSNSVDLHTRAERASEMLREIKDDRIERAYEWSNHKAEREAVRAASKETPVSTSAEDSSEQTATSPAPHTKNEVEMIFEDGFCDFLDQRFQVMWGGVTQEPLDGHKISFTVSSDFARKFEEIVREVLMSWMLDKARIHVRNISRQDSTERKTFFAEQLEDKKVQKELWTAWKDGWEKYMTPQKLPAKPEKKKGGLLGSLTNVVKDAISDRQEYSLEDWEFDTETINNHNDSVHQIKEKLFAESDIYVAPNEEDSDLLMNMFSLSASGLRKQISSIRQIAEDEDSAGRVFETYAAGKDLELALIAVSYQSPNVFLSGEKKMLPHLLAGKKKEGLIKSHPLLLRMLGHEF